MDVQTLVNRAREGDSQAFATLVRRFQDMAVGYSLALTRDFHLAEDAAQDAFLEAFVHLHELRDAAAFPGWFRRIVFKMSDRLTRGLQVKLEPLPAAEAVPSSQPGIAEIAEAREARDRLGSAIETLPEHERVAVVLYYLSGYSQAEVAAFLDVPESTVKKRLFSARRRLREMLMDLVADTLRAHRPSQDDRFAANLLELLGAARAGDVARVGTLLHRNRRLLDARDWLGNSALVVAVNSGQPAVAELLFRAGVEPDAHEAAAIGDASRLAARLDEDPARLDAFSAEGFTPLALAAHYGHEEATRLLLSRGARVDLVSRHPLQVTPLHAALFGRRLGTARMLLERGADVNTRRGGAAWPRSGWTALHYAAGLGLDELIEPLLARGADPALRDDEGRTPAEVARGAGNSGIADRLAATSRKT